jgi:Zn-dependent peptidase ImmA (M78 family)
MKSVSTALHRLGWNRRILTYELFEEVCEREGVLIYDIPSMPSPGFYTIEQGWHVIALDRRVTGLRRALVAWHEFGHYRMHCPGHFGRHTKTEMHADIIAHVAVLPAHLLHLPDGELIELHGYPSEVVAERVRIFRAFNY